MDIKNSGSTNVKVTSSAERAADTTGTTANTDASNTNIVSGGAGGTDVRTIDMSGTNIPDATNAKSVAERAQDANSVNNSTVDASIPNTEAQPQSKGIDYTVGSKNDGSLVKIRLTAPLDHEGVSYDTGDIIEVDKSSANYIVENAKTGVEV